jgi:hypothetical protein
LALVSVAAACGGDDDAGGGNARDDGGDTRDRDGSTGRDRDGGSTVGLGGRGGRGGSGTGGRSGSGGASGNDGDAATSDAGMDASGPATGNGVIQGRVALFDGKTVGGVEVRVGDQTALTDNRGLFRIEDVAPGQHQVKVMALDYTSAQASVDVDQDGIAQLDLTVLQLETVSLADVQNGGTATQGEVSVTLPANALRRGNGSIATGQVEARYAVVNAPETIAAAPGGMRAAMSNGDQVLLESFGMIDMRFYQNDELLELVSQADLAFPLGPNGFADGEEFDVWSFDDHSGLWQLEGRGTVDKSAGVANPNGIAHLQATHMSWWNADQPLTEQGCITGTLLSGNGDPVASTTVNVTGVDYLSSLSTTTDEDGSFCVQVKRDSMNQLRAFGGSGAAYYEWSASATTPASAATCGGSCLDLGNLVGTGLFEECASNVSDDQNGVLLLSSGDAVLDMQVQTLLQSYGNSVTIGPEYTLFDGTIDLSEYDAVYLQANGNWASGDMPEAGQRQLVNWINCGGGLVTVEWTVWKIGSGDFALLDAVYPTVPITTYGTTDTGTYVQVDDDATIHNGLPQLFTFTADSFSGTEIDLVERPGSTVFFDSQERMAGVVGWDFNLGRVVSISTCGGPGEIADAHYGRMVANIVDWLQRDEPNEPSQL